MLNNENGDIACNHYHQWADDLDILQKFGIPHYRCSFSWPRLFPEGIGKTNPDGIAFYDRLIDGLLERGIAPWVTMYHWDLPQALQRKGGWQNRDIIDWFTEYAAFLVTHFGERVENWVILNEPNIHAWFGHCLGFHAPGETGKESYLKAVHHQNIVIGETARLVKTLRPDDYVGSSYQTVPIRTIDPETTEHECEMMDCIWNKNHLQPLFEGSYPEVFQTQIEETCWQDGDNALLKAPLDFIGVQHYNPIYIAKNSEFPYGCFFGPIPEDMERTGYDWPIDPEGIFEVMSDIHTTYGDIDLIITENGAAYLDEVIDGTCHDPERIKYLQSHLASVHRAIEQGIPVKGYFVWSFLDNFEWADGYKYRFGMVHVDYKNACIRTPKSSIRFYENIIRSGGLVDDQGSSDMLNL